jgi:hypothetical protein
MDDMYSAISAMLDNEPVDAAALATALETREGRELLIDLVALRHLVQAPAAAPAGTITRRPPPLWRLVAAAAVVIAAVGGYAIGERRGAPDVTITPAPSPTRIVESSATWQPLPPGGLR